MPLPNESLQLTPQIKNIGQIVDIFPPRQTNYFNQFNGHNAEQWLRENVQNCWWQDDSFKYKINSTFEEAKFCEFW